MKTLTLIIALFASTSFAQTFQVDIIRTAQNGTRTTNSIAIAQAKSDIIGNLNAHTDLIRNSIRTYVQNVKRAQIEATAQAERDAARQALQVQLEAIEAEQ